MVISRFEAVMIEDDETFDEFDAKLNDIVNSRFYIKTINFKLITFFFSSSFIG